MSPDFQIVASALPAVVTVAILYIVAVAVGLSILLRLAARAGLALWRRAVRLLRPPAPEPPAEVPAVSVAPPTVLECSRPRPWNAPAAKGFKRRDDTPPILRLVASTSMRERRF